VLLYFPKMLAAGDIPALVLRSVLTVLMHAVASGILGYFYGLAHFSVEQVQKGHGGHGRVYRLLHQLFLFRRARVYHLVKMFQGLVIAGSYHASYNLAASQGRIGVMLVLVGGGCAFVYYLLGVKSDRQRTGAIAAERSHDTFVRRLRRRAT
jgi:RsiW-degrading membrane proteinase PrsW (M82 family)